LRPGGEDRGHPRWRRQPRSRRRRGIGPARAALRGQQRESGCRRQHSAENQINWALVNFSGPEIFFNKSWTFLKFRTGDAKLVG